MRDKRVCFITVYLMFADGLLPVCGYKIKKIARQIQ